MITICIPAYRAGTFIGETVASVLAQEFDAFELHIAIDPADAPGDDTQTALEPFRDDPRVTVVSNPRRLGWAGNLNALFERVNTDYFVPLPHDDLWTPAYLATLAPLVMQAPEVSVAYADLTFFGAIRSSRPRAVTLPQGEGRLMHLLRFMIQGAHAMPWRGVTRRSALAVTQGFPRDGYGGFAVECEYALGLLEAGAVIHVPQPLYKKRIFAETQRVTASRARLRGLPPDGRADAWSRHKGAMQTRMRRMLVQYRASAEETQLVEAAFQAAMVQRRVAMVAPDMEPAELDAAAARAGAIAHPLAPQVATRIRRIIDDLAGMPDR
jgi:glycosyltransferase involved in cell wall biosynthesis